MAFANKSSEKANIIKKTEYLFAQKHEFLKILEVSFLNFVPLKDTDNSYYVLLINPVFDAL